MPQWSTHHCKTSIMILNQYCFYNDNNNVFMGLFSDLHQESRVNSSRRQPQPISLIPSNPSTLLSPLAIPQTATDRSAAEQNGSLPRSLGPPRTPLTECPRRWCSSTPCWPVCGSASIYENPGRGRRLRTKRYYYWKGALLVTRLGSARHSTHKDDS